jgi:hypothetical protein
MALNGKKSRPITVGDQKYRWKITVDSGYSCVIAQVAEGAGPKLIVFGQVDLMLTPALVHNLIQQAIRSGWIPTGPDFEFRCDLLDGYILKPRALAGDTSHP